MADRKPTDGYVSDEIKLIMSEAIINPDNPESVKKILRGWSVPEVDNMLAALEEAGYIIVKAEST